MHPLTLRYLEERGYQTSGLQSQSWEDLAAFNPDRVVTVCDSAAGETCPLWMGEVEKNHWGLRSQTPALFLRCCDAKSVGSRFAKKWPFLV